MEITVAIREIESSDSKHLFSFFAWKNLWKKKRYFITWIFTKSTRVKDKTAFWRKNWYWTIITLSTSWWRWNGHRETVCYDSMELFYFCEKVFSYRGGGTENYLTRLLTKSTSEWDKEQWTFEDNMRKLPCQLLVMITWKIRKTASRHSVQWFSFAERINEENQS